MATYDLTTYLKKDTVTQKGLNDIVKVEVKLDLPTLFSDKPTVIGSITSFSAADVLQVIDVPDNAIVKYEYCIVDTVEGATATIDIGDGDDPNGFDDNVDINTADGASTINMSTGTAGTDAYYYGKRYKAADTIDVLVNNSSFETAVFRIGFSIMFEDSYV